MCTIQCFLFFSGITEHLPCLWPKKQPSCSMQAANRLSPAAPTCCIMSRQPIHIDGLMAGLPICCCIHILKLFSCLTLVSFVCMFYPFGLHWQVGVVVLSVGYAVCGLFPVHQMTALLHSAAPPQVVQLANFGLCIIPEYQHQMTDCVDVPSADIVASKPAETGHFSGYF